MSQLNTSFNAGENGELLLFLAPAGIMGMTDCPMIWGAIQKTLFPAKYLAKNLAQVMFGVLRHVLVLNLAQNVAQFSDQFCTHSSKCLLNCIPGPRWPGRRASSRGSARR